MDPNVLWQLDNYWTKDLLERMNGDLFVGLNYPTDYPGQWQGNPIDKIAEDDALWELMVSKVGGKLDATKLLRAQIICQQIIWHTGWTTGPEGDGQAKTLRKLWYAGHKKCIQQISERFNVWRSESGQMNDVAANGSMSQVYGEFVDTRLVTYLDLFVKDGSRQFTVFDTYSRLPGLAIVMAIEKDAAYEDCVTIGKALGASAAMSGGGKMGKAGTERMVREALSTHFETETPGDLIDEDNQCYVAVISDYDYDGRAVIAPTFAEQLKRYIPEEWLHFVRVGIEPMQVANMGYDLSVKAYQVKYHVNNAYSSWCRERAMFVKDGQIYHGLADFGENEAVYLEDKDWFGEKHVNCNLARDLTHDQLKRLFETYPPLGLELDALKRVEYAEVIVQGLLEVITWDELLEALSRKAWPRQNDVTYDLTNYITANNKDYQRLSQHLEHLQEVFDARKAELERIKEEFRVRAEAKADELSEDWIDLSKEEDWVKDEVTRVDPRAEQSDLVRHLRQTSPGQHWQPYHTYDRQERLVEIIRQEEGMELNELIDEPISFEEIVL